MMKANEWGTCKPKERSAKLKAIVIAPVKSSVRSLFFSTDSFTRKMRINTATIPIGILIKI